MNVVLSTIGKFHTFHLARQMHRRNALKAIFSGYPAMKLRNEGLPANLVRTFPWLHAPYMRLAPRNHALKRTWEWQDKIWFDRYVADRLPECDVFCGISGSGLKTAAKAKKRGVKYVCDRGSAHIRFQDQILREEYDCQNIRFPGIDPRVINREEEEYELADVITVPSSFALNSFLRSGIAASKIKLALYGVDLSMFYPTSAPSLEEFRVLFVGSVSVQKGVRYLIEAFEKFEHKEKQLTLVGGIEHSMRAATSALKKRPEISLLGHVPQARLKHLMSASHVLVLPSVQDGLGMVQAEAMACGCPVIASENTGAKDLYTNGIEGFITPTRDSDAIAERLTLLADNPEVHHRMRNACLRRVHDIQGWNCYGDKVYDIYSGLLHN